MKVLHGDDLAMRECDHFIRNEAADVNSFVSVSLSFQGRMLGLERTAISLLL